MRTCYVDYSTRSIADLCPGEEMGFRGGWIITRINVPQTHRGKGHGSALLKQICADADAENATLWLEVLSSGGLTADQLVAWYKRYGFEWRGAIMYRRPRRL